MLSCVCMAQKINKPYTSINTALVFGDGGKREGAFGLSGGYQFNKTKVGLGIGIDYHYYKTIPVFIELQRYLMQANKGLVLVANAGINIPSLKDDEKNDVFWPWGIPANNYKYKTGYFFESGLGYSFKTKNKTAITVGVLYSLKTTTQNYRELVYDGSDVVTHEREIKYNLNRTVLKVSVNL